MATPAIQRFRTWNERAGCICQATEETDLARLAELGPEAYADELNEEADRQCVGAAYEETNEAP